MKSVRVFFRKRGKLKYISHLDLNRIMSRFVVMAKLPVWYTEGYHPRPYIVIVSPLSLGFESDFEAVDIRLNEDIDNDIVKERLESVFPTGLEIIKVAQPVNKAGDIAYSKYEITGDFDFDVCGLINSGELEIEKKNKKGAIKKVNIKDNILTYDFSGNVLSVTVATSSEKNLNPNMIITAFEQKLSRDVMIDSVVRKMIYTADMQEFK